MKTLTTQLTPLQIAVKMHEEKNGGPFVPTRKMFYDRVGINQKRFGMLLRGELPMYGHEAKALAEFFNVLPLDLLDTPLPTPRAQVA